MENGHVAHAPEPTGFTVRSILDDIKANLDASDHRPTVPLGHGDPSPFSCFRIAPAAEEAVIDAVRSANFNCYAPSLGIEPARRSVAGYLSRDLPYKLSSDDVYITSGAHHAIEVIMAVLARPGANILFPRPGYPVYHAWAAFHNLEVRHFNLLPEKRWEVDLDGLEALADDKTVAMVVINPGNPCGNVFASHHMKKVAEISRKLGILLISDEVYGHLSFGSNPFVPMGAFGSITPVLTIGSLSKRWIIPGWRLGWIAITDPSGSLQKSWIVKALKSYLDISANPATFIQGAVSQIIEQTPEDFFTNIKNILREAANICYERVKEIPCLTCPHKPEGSMSTVVKLNLSLLEDVSDDMDFCTKLANEESVIVLPGYAIGMKNWLRITFSVDPPLLEDGLERLKAFCSRHAKKRHFSLQVHSDDNGEVGFGFVS